MEDLHEQSAFLISFSFFVHNTVYLGVFLSFFFCLFCCRLKLLVWYRNDGELLFFREILKKYIWFSCIFLLIMYGIFIYNILHAPESVTPYVFNTSRAFNFERFLIMYMSCRLPRYVYILFHIVMCIIACCFYWLSLGTDNDMRFAWLKIIIYEYWREIKAFFFGNKELVKEDFDFDE